MSGQMKKIQSHVKKISCAASVLFVLGTPINHAYAQESLKKLDILLVVDNSGSMSEEQEHLSQKINYLFHYLKGVDWQINIITSDSPCSLDASLPIKADQYVEATKRDLEYLVRTGVAGQEEKPLSMVAHHVNNDIGFPCRDPGSWLRADAKLAIIILTDEEESKLEFTYSYKSHDSVGSKIEVTDKYLSAEDFLKRLKEAHYIPREMVRVYGMMNPFNIGKCGSVFPDENGEFDRDIFDAIGYTHGKWTSVCTDDFGPGLLMISNNLKRFASSEPK